MSTTAPPKSAEQPLAELVGYSMMGFDVKLVEIVVWIIVKNDDMSLVSLSDSSLFFLV
jgi:hypothetical protein